MRSSSGWRAMSMSPARLTSAYTSGTPGISRSKSCPLRMTRQGALVAFGHQDVAVLSEGQPPGMGEPAGDRHHANPRHLGGVEHHRAVGRRQRRHAVAPLSGHRDAGEGEREQRTSKPKQMGVGPRLTRIRRPFAAGKGRRCRPGSHRSGRPMRPDSTRGRIAGSGLPSGKSGSLVRHRCSTASPTA